MAWHIESSSRVGHWVASILDRGYVADRSQALGLVRDGQLIAGVVYENWTRKSIMAHMVVEGRLNRTFIHAIFDYAFNVCDVAKVILTISDDNARSMGLVENMGFTVEARIKDAHPTGDLLIYTLAKPNCRFLGKRYVQKHTSPASRA